MKCYTLICLLIPTVLSWKPISGPTSFSITQSHPALPVAQKLIGKPSGSGSLDAIATYHNGNSFLDENAQGHEDTLFQNNPEGRILSAKPYYHNQIYESIAPTALTGFHGIGGDSCSADKFALDHEGTVQFDASIPSLDQFTLCTWMRFTNHSGDHVLFTYSVNDEPREIQLWIANARGSSFISLAVHGQSLFRLNYPFRMRMWHHACASWNGKTGEWQVWIKAERVGRGFHNRLVNFKVRPHGEVFAGGQSITGHITENLHAEVTFVQLYKIALSAGKAHRDHKHHHVHHFDHNGPITATTTPPPPPSQRPQLVNPLLANGQFPTRVRINLAGAQSTPAPPVALPVQGLPSQLVGGVVPQPNQATITTQFVNGQYHTGSRIISEQLLTGNLLQQNNIHPSQSSQFSFPSIGLAPQSNIQFIDTLTPSKHFLFKREKKTKKRQTDNKDVATADDKKVEKRGLIQLGDGSIIDDSLLGNSEPYAFDGLAQFGDPQFKAHLSKMMNLEDQIKEHDREPAEGEVQAVMAICSACDIEPFEGALVLAWKDAHGRPHNALRAKTMGGCGNF